MQAAIEQKPEHRLTLIKDTDAVAILFSPWVPKDVKYIHGVVFYKIHGRFYVRWNGGYYRTEFTDYPTPQQAHRLNHVTLKGWTADEYEERFGYKTAERYGDRVHTRLSDEGHRVSIAVESLVSKNSVRNKVKLELEDRGCGQVVRHLNGEQARTVARALLEAADRIEQEGE